MGLFNVGFDIENYKDIIPSIDDYLKDDYVINLNEDDLDKCVWKIDEPKILTPDYKRREIKRAMDTGCFLILKGMPIWIPANYYHFLRFFNTGGIRPEFRLNRLMDVYEKIRTRLNPYALGDYTIKSRQIGETTIEMNNCLWQSSKMDFGLIGMQSRTREIVKNSCWRTLVMGWNGLDKWFRDEVYMPDFVSGENIAETMKFIKQATDTDNGKNVMLAYTAVTFDSVSNMRKAVLDEFNKWEENSPYSTFLNYEKFIATGTSRKGLFSIISSPADKETKYSSEVYDFWKGSDPSKLDENGTTSTRIFRHFTSPLTGIEGFYDKWGDADPNPIYDWIHKKRKSVPKEHRLGEIRAYPLDEGEIFGSSESGGHSWSNRKGIKDRISHLENIIFKDERQEEPKCVFGNLDWKGGVMDSDVVFRMADVQQFDLVTARFCFSYFPSNKEELKMVWVEKVQEHRLAPPKIPSNVIGVDPIDKRYVTGVKGFSNASMVNTKFLDFFNTGIVNCPTAYYSCRPQHASISFEDAIKFAIYVQGMLQIESITSKIIDYAEDRGYMHWLISKRGESNNSLRKGDAPSGSGTLMNEIIMLLDDATNTPVNKDDPYLLDQVWFSQVLQKVLDLDPKNTQKFDEAMAWGQSLLGKMKLLNKKTRKPSTLNSAILEYID